jgi:hypothetical protein
MDAMRVQAVGAAGFALQLRSSFDVNMLGGCLMSASPG